MDIAEALQVADKAADRNTPAQEHPSLVHMIYALEILANGHRTYREKAVAWEGTAERLGRELEDANRELDRTQGAWSDLMEFIRAALNLDVRALDDPAEVRKILGRAFADARLWARVKDMAAGKFVAGDVVTADAAGRETSVGRKPTTEWGVRLDVNESMKINSTGGVYIAPEGTDPKDTHKWTLLGIVGDGIVTVETRKHGAARISRKQE